MSDCVAVPDAEILFTLPDGSSFGLALLESVEANEELAARFNREGKSHFDFCRAVARRVEEETGTLLTVSQADWLVDELAEQLAKKKRTRNDRIAALVRSLNSTASSPEALTSSLD